MTRSTIQRLAILAAVALFGAALTVFIDARLVIALGLIGALACLFLAGACRLAGLADERAEREWRELGRKGPLYLEEEVRRALHPSDSDWV